MADDRTLRDGRLLGKVAITGVASGIGAASAALLRGRGWHVTGFDIVEPAVAVDDFVQVDLADARATTAAARSVDGPFIALCNVAGLPPRDGLAARILRVNFLALRQFTQGISGALTPTASIVNVASRAGRQWRSHLDRVKALMALADDADTAGFCDAHGIDSVRAYDLSKEAVIAWMVAETARLGPRGRRMNSVSPGAVDTPILADFEAAFGDRAALVIAKAGRPGSAAEVAEVVAFLAGPESGWMKGTDIAVDGGTMAVDLAEELGL